jgi:hypothetical protein
MLRGKEALAILYVDEPALGGQPTVVDSSVGSRFKLLAASMGGIAFAQMRVDGLLEQLAKEGVRFTQRFPVLQVYVNGKKVDQVGSADIAKEGAMESALLRLAASPPSLEGSTPSAEHPGTLSTAGNLAASLSGQGKYDEAEKMEREVLGVRKRVLEADHFDTLSTAGRCSPPALLAFVPLALVGDLAASPAGQGSVDDIQGGSITSAPEKPGISIASTSAAEPASKRAKQSNNRAP